KLAHERAGDRAYSLDPFQLPKQPRKHIRPLCLDAGAWLGMRVLATAAELPTGNRAIPRRSRRRGSLDSACIRFSAGPMRPRGAETIGAAIEVRYSWEQSVSRLWTGGATPKSNSG